MLMFKHLFFTFALVFLTTLAMARPPVPPGSPVGAFSAIIYNMDDDVILFEHNADAQIPPASLTKVMSLFLALDQIKSGKVDREALAPVSKEAAMTGGSLMGLHAGENVPLSKLLLGMAVSSGNDASHAVAEYIGGSYDNFIKMMNDRAQELGMTNSHFKNPHGLPADGHITTARDMMTLAKAYLKEHPDSLAMHNTLTLEHKGYTGWNKNPLLGQYPGADGLKSGWIKASGHNLIFTAKRNGKRLIGVILGATDAAVRGAEACRLLDAAFLVCSKEAATVTAALDSIPLDLGRIDIQKTPREAGLLKRPVYSKRLLAARRALQMATSAPYTSQLPKPKTVGAQKTTFTPVAKSAPKHKARHSAPPKRKSHAARGQRKANRG